MPVRRVIKHKVGQYTPSQIRVREATSNDAHPPHTIMMDDLAVDVEDPLVQKDVFQILWKRLDDDGKNWRHVHKSLIVLEHLLRHGPSSVAERVLPQLYVITTLQNFQFVDKDGVDQGAHVRDKALSVSALLKPKQQSEDANNFAPSSLAGSPTTDFDGARSPSITALSGFPRTGSQTGIHGSLPKTSQDEQSQLERALRESAEHAQRQKELRELESKEVEMAMARSRSVQDTTGHPVPAPNPTQSQDPWGVLPGQRPSETPSMDAWGAPTRRFSADFTAAAPSSAFGSDSFAPAARMSSSSMSPFIQEEPAPATGSGTSRSTANAVGPSASFPVVIPAKSPTEAPAAVQKPSFFDGVAQSVVDVNDVFNTDFKPRTESVKPKKATLNQMRQGQSPANVNAQFSTMQLAEPLIPLARQQVSPAVSMGMTWTGSAPPGAGPMSVPVPGYAMGATPPLMPSMSMSNVGMYPSGGMMGISPVPGNYYVSGSPCPIASQFGQSPAPGNVPFFR